MEVKKSCKRAAFMLGHNFFLAESYIPITLTDNWVVAQATPMFVSTNTRYHLNDKQANKLTNRPKNS